MTTLRAFLIATLVLARVPVLGHPGHEEPKPAPAPAPPPQPEPTSRPASPLRTGQSPSAERAAKIEQWFRSADPGGLDELRDAAGLAYEGAAELEPPPVPGAARPSAPPGGLGADRRSLAAAQPRRGFASRSVPNLFAAESKGKPAAKEADAKAKGKAEEGGGNHKGAVLGAAVGILAGALIGFALGGPFGAMAGIVIGALAGALAGRLLLKK